MRFLTGNRDNIPAVAVSVYHAGAVCGHCWTIRDVVPNRSVLDVSGLWDEVVRSTPRC